MKWEDVFDKYFIIRHETDRVLVFVPGSYTGDSIRYDWTTVEDLENGVDPTSGYTTTYGLYGEERDAPGELFQDAHPIVKLTQEEKVCKKIKVLEERFQNNQQRKKAVKLPRATHARVDWSAVPAAPYPFATIYNSW
jgi:hypothetical protein